MPIYWCLRFNLKSLGYCNRVKTWKIESNYAILENPRGLNVNVISWDVLGSVHTISELFVRNLMPSVERNLVIEP